MDDLNIIDQFTQTFVTYIDSGFGLLSPDVAFLTTILIGIDITLAGLFWTMADDKSVIPALIKKVLYIGVFAYILNNFAFLSRIIFESFAGLGLRATGTGLAISDLMRPGFIAATGYDAAEPLLLEVGNLLGPIAFFENFITIFVLIFAWIVVLLAFFILAIQLFITILEFKLTTLAGFVLIPFALWSKTSFLAEKVLGNVISSGIKLMVLAVIVGIGSTIFSAFTNSLPARQSLSSKLFQPYSQQCHCLCSAYLAPASRRVLSPAHRNLVRAVAGTALGLGVGAAAAGRMAMAGAGAAASGVGGAVKAGSAMAGGASASYNLARATSGASGGAGVAKAGAGAVAQGMGKAAQVWDERIGSARLQARNWRLMAFGCLALLGALSSALIWQSLQSRITPYVIEVDTLGEVRTIGPATVVYKPSDAQIAYQLAAFIKRVRAVSVDPIVVREQWLAAYDFTTDRAAQILNEYARENDPFTDVGRRSIAVEITSVVRASEDSFQIKWIERHYMGGAFQKLERHTAILTIVFQQPATVTALTKNPLGLYVHGLNWSRDMGTPERE